jgi:4-azaleucine resistance transporter AzlC
MDPQTNVDPQTNAAAEHYAHGKSENGEQRRACGDEYLTGARAAMPFALATVVLGVSFGILARSLDWGILAPIAFSIFAFSGSAQFAVAAVLSTGGGVFAAVVAAVLILARFLPMGVAVAPSLKGGRFRRALEGQALLDASWAMANRGGGRFDRAFLIGATIPQYIAWVGGTVAGVLAGNLLGSNLERFGLDAIFPAFFLALLVNELRSDRRAVTVALLAAILAIILVPFTAPGVPVIAAAAAALLGFWRRSS